MKNCLIIQHYDLTSAGSTFDWLVKNSIPYHVWRVDLEPEPDLKKFDAMIVCGGRQNVDEEHLYPWMKREKQIIKEWSEKGAPYLGLCLGGQLLAEAIGGEVGPHKGWEIGWHPVKLVEENKELTSFQFHRYRFIPPAKAKSIAQGDYCTHQGFSYKKSLGFQFHPESSKEWIMRCTQSIKPEYAGQIQTPQQIVEQMKLQIPLQEWFYKLLDQWRDEKI